MSVYVLQRDLRFFSLLLNSFINCLQIISHRKRNVQKIKEVRKGRKKSVSSLGLFGKSCTFFFYLFFFLNSSNSKQQQQQQQQQQKLPAYGSGWSP